jgi:hypothetical protein
MRRQYTAELRAALAAAQPWDMRGWSLGRRAPQPQAGATYVVPYTIEQYTRLAVRMKLWPYPRAHYQHLTVVPWM